MIWDTNEDSLAIIKLFMKFEIFMKRERSVQKLSNQLGRRSSEIAVSFPLSLRFEDSFRILSYCTSAAFKLEEKAKFSRKIYEYEKVRILKIKSFLNYKIFFTTTFAHSVTSVLGFPSVFPILFSQGRPEIIGIWISFLILEMLSNRLNFPLEFKFFFYVNASNCCNFALISVNYRY